MRLFDLVRRAWEGRADLGVKPIAGLVRLGDDDGGWIVPSAEVGDGTVAYCAGAGEDISFDLALYARGCTVVTFDPTPRAVKFVERVAPAGPRFRFVPVGWWDRSAEVRFFAPRDPSHVSHSVVNLQRTGDYFLARVKPVAELQRELEHETVHLIKMDIEGAEYRVIRSLLSAGPRPRVLCLEFHPTSRVWRLRSAVRRLRAAGYSLVAVEGANYTFVCEKPLCGS